MGEELAIDSLKSGATDYVLKDRLARLVPAVRRAMQEVEQKTAKRQTVEALRETEQRLRIVFNESPMGIALVGADGRPFLTNAALQNMLGYTGEELRRMAFREFTHPEDCAKDLALYRQLVQGAIKHYQMEKRYIRKDGNVVWGHLSVWLARQAAPHGELAIGMVRGHHGPPKACRRSLSRPRKWKWSAIWRAAWPMILTTSWPSLWVTAI